MTTIAGFLHVAALGLAASFAIAAMAWLASLPLRDVSIVDSAWPVLVLAPPCVAFMILPQVGVRAYALLSLATLWALRLAVHITRRHWGKQEDRRYRAIRERNEPHFAWKSLYLVFGLQAVLAWLVSMPLLATIGSDATWSWLDLTGIVLFAIGLGFETLADAQLARFTRESRNRGRVMTGGLWRYSRHPNYFGEFCVWWGLWLVALSSGAWWTAVSPLLMTILLLQISGVPLLERDMAKRRPDYASYAARTNGFFPWKPRA